MKGKILGAGAALAVLAASLPANAAVTFDADVTNNAIYGSGNANGGWTIDRNNALGLELGLRAKVRYDVSDDQPKNIFNSNGDGTYSHVAGGGPAPNQDRARWNFEWSINTNYTGMSGLNLNDLTYSLSLDYNPGNGTTFEIFDPINLPAGVFADHSIGTNATGEGMGVEATNVATYLALIDANNLAQNSWNLAFFDNPPPFDPTIDGTYDFILSAFDASGQVGSTRIQVIVGAGATDVPEPATGALLLTCVAALGIARRRKSAR